MNAPSENSALSNGMAPLVLDSWIELGPQCPSGPGQTSQDNAVVAWQTQARLRIHCPVSNHLHSSLECIFYC